ncbi:bifunctional hydroxymethylpyrimidine kinase/phosphomethylpyrimidine kinase [Desulfatiferula olefinivorans]
MKPYIRALTIAGSDSGGGAGIQADLKTFSALGCYGMTAITAITAQNTEGVQAVYPMDPSCVAAQIASVLSDIGADAVKIGMIWSSELAGVVAEVLGRYPVPHVVFDPVMVAQSGDSLLDDTDSRRMVTRLAPHVHLITPNLSEAERLLGRTISGVSDMEKAVRDLADLGCPHVLLKGGHLDGPEATDFLYLSDSGELIRFTEKRIDTPNNHGTGCTLSSAVAAFLAKGKGMNDAVRLAKDYVTRALEAGARYRLGRGHGPVYHFHGIWPS